MPSIKYKGWQHRRLFLISFHRNGGLYSQETAREHQKKSAIAFSPISLLIHGDVVITRYEHAFTFLHTYLFSAVVENHLARIDIIERKLPWTVNASAQIIIKEAVKNIIVVEYQLHRAMILFLVYCHDPFIVDMAWGQAGSRARSNTWLASET